MRIHFIGTSHGAPEKGRKCTATLFETKGVYYAVDCGTSVEQYAKDNGISHQSIRALFVTHMHADHCGQLSNFVKMFTVYGNSGIHYICLPEQAGIEGYMAWHKAQHLPPTDGKIEFIKSTDDVFYKDENVTVCGVKTDHIHGFDTYGYIIEAEGKRLLFTGDLSADIHDYPQIAHREHFDAVVSELTHFGGSDSAAEVLLKTKTDHLIFNHIYPGNEKWIESYRNQFSYPVTITNDDDIIEI